jgi:hypothetical protein
MTTLLMLPNELLLVIDVALLLMYSSVFTPLLTNRHLQKLLVDEL